MRGVGPEIISGASDNDPTNVGTAAVVGAQTGYQLCWVALLVAPLMGAVLAIAAQVGVVARSDLQSLARRRYGRLVAGGLLVSVVVVNVVTIAADLQAGAAGIGLLTGVGSRWLVLPLALALTAMLLIGRYGQVVAVLRWVLLGFVAFAVAAVLAHPDWPRLAQGGLAPVLPLRHDELTGALALLGTTMTSYVYFWETVQRGVEEPPGRRPDSQNRGGSGLARPWLGAVAGAVFTAVDPARVPDDQRGQQPQQDHWENPGGLTRYLAGSATCKPTTAMMAKATGHQCSPRSAAGTGLTGGGPAGPTPCRHHRPRRDPAPPISRVSTGAVIGPVETASPASLVTARCGRP